MHDKRVTGSNLIELHVGGELAQLLYTISGSLRYAGLQCGG